MTYSELLFAFHFTETAAERRVEKQRVVTETAGAAWLVKDLAFDRAAKRFDRVASFGQGDDADEARRPLGRAG